LARINGTHGVTPFQQLLGYNTEILNAWTNLGNLLEKDGLLSYELKEQVRKTLAQGNGCEYCKAKGKPEPHLYDENTAIATAFADVALKQKGVISDSVFIILSDCFSEGEISELCVFITFTIASQYLGAILDLKP
jgi:alkylhydroperoxidase family enzyme